VPVVSESLPLRRVAALTRLDFWFDAAILVGYTVAYSYGFTGVVIHEWLGIALGIALLLHITLHWDWVVRTTGRLLRPRGPDKLIWLVNLALLFAMTLCVGSGILISRVALPELRISLPLDDQARAKPALAGLLGKYRVAPLAVPHRPLVVARRPGPRRRPHEERADPAGVREPVAGDRVPEADAGGDEQRD
jgi:hypothetical protein